MTGFAGTPRYGRTVDLHQWMTTDLAGLRNRLVDTVLSLVPHDRWHEQADGGEARAHGVSFRLIFLLAPACVWPQL